MINVRYRALFRNENEIKELTHKQSTITSAKKSSSKNYLSGESPFHYLNAGIQAVAGNQK